MNRILSAFALTCGTLVSLSPWLHSQSFEILETGDTRSLVFDVSDDGSVVTGARISNPMQAFRWENGEVEHFEFFTGQTSASGAYVSGNGEIVVGGAGGDSPGFRWENSTNIPLSIAAFSISGDGNTIVGIKRVDTKTLPFKIVDGVEAPLPILPGTVSSGVRGVSFDGTVITGQLTTEDEERNRTVHVVQWVDNELIPLPNSPGTRPGGWAQTVSDDGTVVAGNTWTDEANPAAYWKDGELFNIGTLGGIGARILATTTDGSTMVGDSNTIPEIGSPTKAFIWTASDGMRVLEDVLQNDFGLNLQGANLTHATGMTPDGTTIVGYGSDPQNPAVFYGWRAQLPKIGFTVSIPEGSLDIGDVVLATVKVSNNLPDPITVTLDNPLLITDKEAHLEFGELEDIAPFTLTPENRVREFIVPIRILKRGIAEVFAGGIAEETSGNQTILGGSEEIIASPLSTEITVTPEDTVLNLTDDSEKTPRCLEFETNKDGEAIWTDCVEVKAVITNVTEETIVNVEVPLAEDVLKLITSTKQDKPNVPLTLLDWDVSSGKQEVNAVLKPIPETLDPDEAVTYTWYLGTIDADPEESEPAELEIEVLSLGGIDGTNVRGFETAEINVIDEILLEWGIQNRAGRSNFLGGQTVWVDGFLRNVSKDAGKEQDLRVMIFQVPEGNVAGGFMVPVEGASAEELRKIGNMPFNYAVFELPAEEPQNEIAIQSLFRSMPLPVASTGKIKYVVRLWTVEDDGEGGENVSNADGQAKVADDWVKEFEVSFKEELSLEDTWIEDCERLGVYTWLCAMEQSFYTEFMEGILQLGILGKAAIAGSFTGGYKLLAYEAWILKTGWDALKGDPEAVAALVQESYEQYQTLYNLKLLSEELLNQSPLLQDQFVDFVGDSLSGFFSAVENGDMRELQIQIGSFVGANPDLALEPIAALGTLAKLRPAIRAASRGLEESLEAAKLRQAVKKNKDLDARIAQAEADPNVRNLYRALAAGDELTDAQLLKIYGISSKELRDIQKIAKDNNITLAFRSRNPRSVELLEAVPPQAYPKPHALETFKSVNEIDRKYLGYRDEANGIIEIVEPPGGLGNVPLEPEELLDTRIKEYMVGLKQEFPELAANDVLLDETEKRLKRRVKEWQDALGQLKIEDPNPAEINVNFAGQKQFVHDQIEDKGAKEIRQIQKTPIDDRIDPVSGSRQRVWKIEMSGPNGGPPLPVTGDIDFLAILDRSGMFITNPEKRKAIYSQLAEAIGMQHGESYSFMFQKNREEWLRCCVEGKEPVMTVGPNGQQRPTAGFFVDNMSTFPDGPNAVVKGPRKTVFKDGNGASQNGIEVTMRHIDPSGEFPLFNGTAALMKLPKAWESRFTFQLYQRIVSDFFQRRLYFLPSYIQQLVDDDQQSQSTTPSGQSLPTKAADQPPVFSIDGPVIQVTQESNPYFATGSLSHWTEQAGWTTITTVQALELGDPAQLDLAPMSALEGGASAGDTRVDITSLEDQEMTGDFFEVGDRVVINPGGANEESAIVQSLGSLEFTAPLIFDHDGGEPIVFIERDVLDSDGDGLSDEQEDDLGTDSGSADTDQDGISDRAELAYGTDPLDGQSLIQIVTFGALEDGQGITLSWTDEPGRQYLVEVSNDLSSDSWTPVERDIESGEEITIDYFNSSSNRIFYRVRLDS